MRILVLMLALSLLGGCNKEKALQQPVVATNVQTVVMKVKGMDCAACPITVRKALERVPGVIRVSVSFENKTALVNFDSTKTRVSDLTQATARAGYESVISGEKK